jgi:hypothetical protein
MYKFDRFLPTFELENMGFGHFWSKIFRIFLAFMDDFGQKFGHLPTFCPLLKMDLTKFGSPEAQ